MCLCVIGCVRDCVYCVCFACVCVCVSACTAVVACYTYEKEVRKRASEEGERE